jgi:transporter family-2 protein
MNTGGLLAGVLLAALVGAFLPVQAGANGLLGRSMGDAMLATFWSLLTSTVVVGVVLLATRPSLPQAAALSKLPLWAWCGGVLGAMYVATATVFAPRLGAAVFIVAVVAGQLVSSLVLDGRGWFGYSMRDIGVGRLVGVALVAIGCALVTLSTGAKAPTS